MILSYFEEELERCKVELRTRILELDTSLEQGKITDKSHREMIRPLQVQIKNLENTAAEQEFLAWSFL